MASEEAAASSLLHHRGETRGFQEQIERTEQNKPRLQLMRRDVQQSSNWGGERKENKEEEEEEEGRVAREEYSRR